MPRHRTIEPIAPTNIPGEPLDPKIPPEMDPEHDDEAEEPEAEQLARIWEKAFGQAITPSAAR
jgi:hypothetical protein